ncbi:MAG: cytidylate kinase-like family protein [Pseudomonadota bacterium]
MSLVTISSSMGCGGAEIAKLVAEGLKLELYDDKRLQEEAIKMGITSEDLKGFDEKAPGFFDRILNSKPEAYLDYMEAVVYEVSQRGEGVILGHGSQILLQDFGCALHVLIHAPESTRLQNLMDRQGLSAKAAEKLIWKSDHEKKGFFRFAFHKEASDPSHYDLTINTEKLSGESAAKLVMEAAELQEIKTCSLSAMDAMDRLSQIKKIQAVLLKNNINMTMLNVEVPEKGVAEISGLANSEEEKKEILKYVKSVPEISEVRYEVVLKPAGY